MCVRARACVSRVRGCGVFVAQFSTVILGSRDRTLVYFVVTVFSFSFVRIKRVHKRREFVLAAKWIREYSTEHVGVFVLKAKKITPISFDCRSLRRKLSGTVHVAVRTSG